mmetsp:Transcript_34253/g.53437  ORF Transcript_34253/g.53437 Transcript_34253/m.53437 type:complete len:702 (+) Transcript_34253:264-2369(+)
MNLPQSDQYGLVIEKTSKADQTPLYGAPQTYSFLDSPPAPPLSNPNASPANRRADDSVPSQPASWGGQSSTDGRPSHQDMIKKLENVLETMKKSDKPGTMDSKERTPEPKKGTSSVSPTKGEGSVEGRINNVLEWLDHAQENETKELEEVQRQLGITPESSVRSDQEMKPVERMDTVAAVMGEGDEAEMDEDEFNEEQLPVFKRKPQPAAKSRNPKSAGTQGRGSGRGKAPKCGLGLTLRNPDDKPGIVIKRVKEGGPAAVSAKIVAGDRLMAVDKVALSQNMSGEEIAGLIVGRKGSVVTLQVKKQGGKTVDVVLERFESAEERMNKPAPGRVISKQQAPEAAASTPMSEPRKAQAPKPQPSVSQRENTPKPRAPEYNEPEGDEIDVMKYREPLSQDSWQSDVTAAGYQSPAGPSSLNSSVNMGGAAQGYQRDQDHMSNQSLGGMVPKTSLSGAVSSGLQMPIGNNSLENILQGYGSFSSKNQSASPPESVESLPWQQKKPPSGTGPIRQYNPDYANQRTPAVESQHGPLSSEFAAPSSTGGARRKPNAFGPIGFQAEKESSDDSGSGYATIQTGGGLSKQEPSVDDIPRDPSTEVFSYQEEVKPSPGKLYGLGVTFKKSDGHGGMVVKRVKTEGAAAASRALTPGDRVLSINGTALDDVSDAMQLAKLTHGEKSSVAVLQVQRQSGVKEEVIIVRGERM